MARDPEVGRYLIHSPGETLEDLRARIRCRLEGQRVGTDLPFTTVLRADGRPVGMTGFMPIDRTNRSVEVGRTWLNSAFWRSPVNTESKYLLFQYAFETGQVHRIMLQTDVNNERSQRAIERLGSVRGAKFREDKLGPNGSYRTSVYYGILVSEWPNIKDHPETKVLDLRASQAKLRDLDGDEFANMTWRDRSEHFGPVKRVSGEGPSE